MRIVELPFAVVLALPAVSLGIVTAGPANAECDRSGGVTLCSEGSESSGASVALPYFPYPCEDDWLCADGGLSLLDPGGLNVNRDTPGGSYTD
jgi:hypothetical protein